MNYLLNRMALERLKALVRAGKFTGQAWSWTPVVSNAILGTPPNWPEYANWMLGKREGAPDPSSSGAVPTKDDFAYPFGDGKQVFLAALREIASRVSAGGDGSISTAASEMLAIAAQQQSDAAKASAITASADPNDKNQLTFLCPVEIKAADSAADGKAAGPPTFDMNAYGGGPLRLKGWQYPVVVDFSGMEGMEKNRPALRDHDPGKIVGHTTKQSVEDGMLKAHGLVSGHGPHVDEVVKTSANDFPWQASIGARVHKNEFIPEGRTATANGQTWEGPINIARRTSLGEISFVALGADDSTSARIAATAAKGSIMKKKFAAWMKAAGFKASEMDDESMKCAKALYKAQAKADPDDGNDEDYDEERDGTDEKKKQADADTKKKAADAKAAKAAADLAIQATDSGGAQLTPDQEAEAHVKAQRAALKKERERQGQITAKLDEYKPHVDAEKFKTIEASAIDDGWDADKTELALLRARRPDRKSPAAQPFNINAGAGSEPTTEIIAAACSLAAGVGEKYAMAGLNEQQKNIVASGKVRNAFGSVYDICAYVAQVHGLSLGSNRMNRDVLASMQRIENRVSLDISADGGGTGGMSTLSLSGITENIMNKALMEGYNMVQSVVSELCYESDTNDFKQTKRYRITASGILAALGAAGELKSISLQDESYSNQVKTQGVILNIPRELLLNDDLGAITQAPTMLGRGSLLYREMVIIGIYLGLKALGATGASVGDAPNNFKFISTGAGNYLTGAASALSEASMTAAVQAFREQTDANSMPIMLNPDHVLVPPALEAANDKLFNASNLIVTGLASTAAKSVDPDYGVHKGKYRTVLSPFLAESVAGKIKKLKGDPIFANYANASDKQWSLLAKPAGGFAPIQLLYLRGQRVPIIERGESNFNQLGIAMRCYYDFGGAAHDYRTVVWNDGQ